jgi:hypothetical protein
MTSTVSHSTRRANPVPNSYAFMSSVLRSGLPRIEHVQEADNHRFIFLYEFQALGKWLERTNSAVSSPEVRCLRLTMNRMRDLGGIDLRQEIVGTASGPITPLGTERDALRTAIPGMAELQVESYTIEDSPFPGVLRKFLAGDLTSRHPLRGQRDSRDREAKLSEEEMIALGAREVPPPKWRRGRI